MANTCNVEKYQVELLAARVGILYNHLPFIVAAKISGVSYLYLCLNLSSKHSFFSYWYFITFSLIAIIIAAYLVFKYKRYVLSEKKWLLLRFLIGVGLGINLSLCSIILFHDSSPENIAVILSFVNSGIGIAVLTSSASPSTFNVFISIVLLPIIIFSILENNFMLLFFQLVVACIAVTLCRQGKNTIVSSLFYQFENAELVKQLKDQKKVAEDANLAKSRLLISASHDLRQPMHALRLFMDVFEKRGAQNGPELINYIRSSVINIGDLFDSLLDVNKFDLGNINLNYSNFLISSLIGKLIDEYEPIAKEKNIAIVNLSKKSVVCSDEVIVERILRNLISNAIKYTDKGVVKIYIDENDDIVKVNVEDTGIGINDNDKEKIFSEFYQGESIEKKCGVGLGLAIVSKLADVLEIDVGVESKFFQGSKFWFELPAGDEFFRTNKSESREKPPCSLLERKTIFVIDDEESNAVAMAMMFRKYGARVFSFKNYGMVVVALKDNNTRPDLIVSDFHFRHAVLNVNDICLLRQFWDTIPPIIIVTGDLTFNSRRLTALAVNIVSVVYKPVTPDLLLHKVGDCLSRSVNNQCYKNLTHSSEKMLKV